MKEVKWNKNAQDLIRSLDRRTRIEIGTLLMMLQAGAVLTEPQSKPMKSIHSKAHELRIRDKNGIYRIIYVLIFSDLILIPHAFIKKTQKTSKKDIELSMKRLKEMLNENK